MAKQLLLSCLFLLYLTQVACNRKTTETTEAPEPPALHENCALQPEPGPCRMALTRYYYDAETKTCKSFIYGGCQGVVPFETLSECQKKCKCLEEE
ncbi:MAG: BPTI/Kunitz domain-containing protein [Phaeodactylibacter sp.]|nr:BPTI/Kunitz domain-containing protein [Phaeodactylibacter sp.]